MGTSHIWWQVLEDLHDFDNRLVAEFRAGRLFLSTPTATLAFATYPEPQVFQKTRSQPRWSARSAVAIMDIERDTGLSTRTLSRDGSLPVGPVRPHRACSESEERRGAGRLRNNRQAFRTYWSLVPGRIRKQVARFPKDCYQWGIFRLCCISIHGLELCESNAALALAMVFVDQINRPPLRTPGGAAAFLRTHLDRPRTEILAALGFPAQEWAVRVFGKIAPGEFSWQFFPALRGMLHDSDSETRKLLHHLPALNGTVLRILSSRDHRAAFSFRFLEAISRFRIGKDGRRLPIAINRLLDDTVRMAVIMNQSLQQIHTVDELLATHDELVRQLGHRGIMIDETGEVPLGLSDSRFPPPPFPGEEGLRPITTLGQLAQEGRTLRHCCLSYIHQVVAGEMAFYSLLRPERATVALARRSAGWTIYDIRGQSNRGVRAATWRRMERWLGEVQRQTSVDAGAACIEHTPDAPVDDHALTDRNQPVGPGDELQTRERFLPGMDP